MHLSRQLCSDTILHRRRGSGHRRRCIYLDGQIRRHRADSTPTPDRRTPPASQENIDRVPFATTYPETTAVHRQPSVVAHQKDRHLVVCTLQKETDPNPNLSCLNKLNQCSMTRPDP